MHFQKEVKSNPKQPSCKIVCSPEESHFKKIWNPRWWPRNGCDGWQWQKNDNNNLGEFVPNPNETWRRQHKFT